MTALLLAEGGGFNPFEFAPGAAVWTLVAFLLALPLMHKFVFGPILQALEKRDQKVEDAILAADEARRRAEEQVAAAKQQLEEARAEGRRMVQDALSRAERQAQDALREAKVEAERQLKKARESIDAERRRALADIRQEVVQLSIAASSRILKKSVDDQSNRALVQEFLGSVGGGSTRSGG